MHWKPWFGRPLLDSEGLEEMLEAIGAGLKPVPDEKRFTNPDIVIWHANRHVKEKLYGENYELKPRPYLSSWIIPKPKPKPAPWVPSEPAMPVVAPVSDEEFITLVFQKDETAAMIKYRARIDAEIHFNMGARYIKERDELCKLAALRLERFNLPTDETSCGMYADAYLAYAYYH